MGKRSRKGRKERKSITLRGSILIDIYKDFVCWHAHYNVATRKTTSIRRSGGGERERISFLCFQRLCADAPYTPDLPSRSVKSNDWQMGRFFRKI